MAAPRRPNDARGRWDVDGLDGADGGWCGWQLGYRGWLRLVKGGLLQPTIYN